jgi:uncharacterized membrane protein YdjX (TVP38/TMEM64 family)
METTRTPPARAPLLLAEVAPRAWDTLLWGSGVVGVLGIAASMLAPDAADLTALFALSLFCNGPYSPLLPATMEPLVMIYGQVYPPLLVAAIATLAAVLAEIVDFRLYEAAFASHRLASARNSRMARWVVRWFERAPFLATVACAATPIPFWLARCCAIVAGYPLRRFLIATALGRVPRWWLYAAIGAAFNIGASWLLGGAAALTLAWIAVALVRRTPPTG